ncbi:hypothetical protein [Anaerocolumna sp. MB42-C2]|uniref:hypothetical protein n=1 Tax=Anaerocolumna sp. MB42-C2 TaxID=3070997 RepID=UPI0027E06AF9|nr:hypothetical protein [Anaerocolumna sp. MB42-C2]WMJ89992.1 hypothetical protein RBU59_10830 [Anaerocolumna sp. MB42-C2]
MKKRMMEEEYSVLGGIRVKLTGAYLIPVVLIVLLGVLSYIIRIGGNSFCNGFF